MLDLKFWRQKSNRYNNPTFSSKLVQSSVFVQKINSPNKQYSQKHEVSDIRRTYSMRDLGRRVEQNKKIEAKQDNLQKIQNLQGISQQKRENNESAFVKNSFSSDKILKSNIQSLKKDLNQFFYSSKEVFQKQQNKYDTISGNMKEVKTEINMFPKLRLEKLDKQYKRRQAFLRGDMQSIKKIRQQCLNRQSILSQRGQYISSSILMHRRRFEPVQTAFKITENPELIQKKLIFQK